MNLINKVVAEICRGVGWLFWNPVQIFMSNHTDCFQYHRLLKLRFFGNPFMIQENSWYGHSRAIKNAGGSCFGSRIEHGVFFAENTIKDMEDVFTSNTIRFFRLRRVYTYSERRRRVVLKYLISRGLNMEVVAIGPYIRYACHFHSKKELACLKRKLGRVLLVYPQHSTETVVHNYDLNVIVERIKRLKSSYDTVLVSLYWADILKGDAQVYEAAGCIVVCAGRREDPNSLSRQKDILTLADRILSNAVGTYVGYAISMGKPCTLFRQDVETNVCTEAELQNHMGSKANMDPFFIAFAAEDEEITSEQLKLVNEFWGEWE